MMTRSLFFPMFIFFALFANPAPSFAASCARAPLPRLRVDAQAVVSPDVTRINMRALPAVDTGIVRQIFANTPLTVISGPSCNGYYHWWRVENANGERGWIAEGTWEMYYVLPQEDADRPPDPFEVTCNAHLLWRWCAVPF